MIETILDKTEISFSCSCLDAGNPDTVTLFYMGVNGLTRYPMVLGIQAPSHCFVYKF